MLPERGRQTTTVKYNDANQLLVESNSGGILNGLAVTHGLNTATYIDLVNSPLVSQILFKIKNTTRMTTTRNYDDLNCLAEGGKERTCQYLELSRLRPRSPKAGTDTFSVWNTGKWVNFYSYYDPIVYLDMYPNAGWNIPIFFAPSFTLDVFNPPGVDDWFQKNMSGAIMLSIPEHGAYWNDADVLNRIRKDLQ